MTTVLLILGGYVAATLLVLLLALALSTANGDDQ